MLMVTVLTGCPAGPTSGMSLEAAPDGDIEILAIDQDGGIAHQPGRFLQSVKPLGFQTGAGGLLGVVVRSLSRVGADS
jgi:hypothetical protein